MAAAAKSVHHVVWCVEPGSLDAVRRLWEDGLGVPLQVVDLPEHGVVVLISWEAGIEIISPVHPEGELAASAREHLARHGEGVYSVVFNVPDIDSAVESLTRTGAVLQFRDDISAEQFDERDIAGSGGGPSTALRQAVFGAVSGIRLCLQQEGPAGA